MAGDQALPQFIDHYVDSQYSCNYDKIADIRSHSIQKGGIKNRGRSTEDSLDVEISGTKLPQK